MLYAMWYRKNWICDILPNVRVWERNSLDPQTLYVYEARSTVLSSTRYRHMIHQKSLEYTVLHQKKRMNIQKACIAHRIKFVIYGVKSTQFSSPTACDVVSASEQNCTGSWRRALKAVLLDKSHFLIYGYPLRCNTALGEGL